MKDNWPLKTQTIENTKLSGPLSFANVKFSFSFSFLFFSFFLSFRIAQNGRSGQGNSVPDHVRSPSFSAVIIRILNELLKNENFSNFG